MDERVDILVVAETVSIARACTAEAGGSWNERRLPDGFRFYLGMSGGARFALASVDALAPETVLDLLERLARKFRPDITVFIGTAVSYWGAANPYDLVVAKELRSSDDDISPASSSYQVSAMVIQELLYFERSDAWSRLIKKLPFNATETTVQAGVVRSQKDPVADDAAVDCSGEFYSYVQQYPWPRWLVLCVRAASDADAEDNTSFRFADLGVAERMLARFLMAFLPEQVRAGTLRAPVSVPNVPSDDDDLAPLIREHVDGLRVTSVSLTNFKCVGDLKLNLGSAPTERCAWTCIAGINGSGKSAVLQAITIALLGDRLAAELGGDWLQRTRRLRDGVRHDASIAVTVQPSQRDPEQPPPAATELRVELGETGIDDRTADHPSYRRMRALWKARGGHHLLRAYGPGRNLSEHLDNRYAKLSPDVQAVMTLFDPLTQVASAEALVEKVDDDGFLGHLAALADHVLQDFDLKATVDGASLRFATQGAQLSVVDLPDGFRATLAWLADLCLAWYSAASPADRATGLSTLRATVLIDEIDLHLHPKLQRTLVPRLREKLPGVQWIVTTHSPLVLACFDRTEIVLLEPDPEHGVRRRELDRQIMGFTLDEIVGWLMETPPRSLALDQVAKAPVDPEARLAFLLSLSPDIDENDARAALDEVQARRMPPGAEAKKETGS